MPFTIWSKGRLLGNSELDWLYRDHGHRMGWFHPTELGDHILENYPASQGRYAGFTTRSVDEVMANLIAFYEHVEHLELELRGPDGKRVAATDISLRDTDLGSELVDAAIQREDIIPVPFDPTPEVEEEDSGLEELLESKTDSSAFEEETPFPRYQLMIKLAEHCP